MTNPVFFMPLCFVVAMKSPEFISDKNRIRELEQELIALKTELAAYKQKETILRSSAHLYRAVIKSAPDVILSLDQNGTVLLANETPDGDKARSIVGKSIFDLIATPAHATKLKNAISYVFETKDKASYEHMDGKGFWHETRVAPIIEVGKVVAVSVIGTNINKFKTLETEYLTLLETEHRQREIAEALRDVGVVLSSTLDLNKITNSLLDQINRVVPYDAANIMVVDKGVAKITNMRGYESSKIASSVEFEGLSFVIADTPNLRKMAISKKPLIISNTEAHPDWIQIRQKSNIRSWAGAPIIIQGEVVAFFSLDKAEPDFYQPRDTQRLLAFCGQAAVAIKNARLFQEVKANLAKTEALYLVGQSISNASNLEMVLEAVVDSVAKTLPAHTVVLSTLNIEEGENLYFVKGGPGAKDIESISFEALKSGLSGWVMDEQQPGLSHKGLPHLFEKNTPLSKPLTNQHGSVIAVPLRYKNIDLGTITAINPEKHTAYTPEDSELLETMANQVALAIQNAHLNTRSNRQAKLVQQVLDSVQQGILLLDKNKRIRVSNPLAKTYLQQLANINDRQQLISLGDVALEQLLLPPADGHWHELTVSSDKTLFFRLAAHPINEKLKSEDKGWVIVLVDASKERALQQHMQQQDRLAAVGQMSAGIAHDFNNILTSIIGFADLLTRRPSMPDSAKPALNHIISQGKRAAILIEQILDFSRQSVMQKEVVAFDIFLKETLKILPRLIPESITISLEQAPNKSGYMLEIDPSHIQQVLINLAINARDAMPNGGILAFKLFPFFQKPGDPLPTPDIEPGEWIALSATDNGTGIPADILSLIFEPFFTTKDVGKGTGLGLSQAYGILKQHKGGISVKSVVNEGTTVTLYFRASKISQAAGLKQSYQPSLPIGHNETILLVEDEPSVLEITSKMLSHLGYRVITAGDGYEALAQYDKQAQEIALVLSDVTMPRLGGTALAKILKERNSAIKVLLLSGYPLETGSKELLSNGVLGWIKKPIDLPTLADAVSHALS